MTRTIVFLVGCTALISGDLPACAAGIGWKVFSHQSVKEPDVCFYGSANVVRANGLLGVWTKCVAKEDLKNAVKEDLLVRSRISPLKKSRTIMFLRSQRLRPWREIKSLMPLSTKNWLITAIFDRL